jgi:hypothetical protein
MLYFIVSVLVCRFTLASNDLQIGDGRDTEALNCKPITNF